MSLANKHAIYMCTRALLGNKMDLCAYELSTEVEKARQILRLTAVTVVDHDYDGRCKFCLDWPFDTPLQPEYAKLLLACNACKSVVHRLDQICKVTVF